MPENPPGFDARTYRLTPDVRLRLRGEGLSAVTLLVLDALVDHDWTDRHGRRKGYCWPKVATLAAKVGYTERTVQTHLGLLMRAGLIVRIGNGGRGLPAVVTLNWPTIMGEPETVKLPAPAGPETVKRRPPAPKAVEEKNQQKPAAPASALQGAPPRRVERSREFDGVPCPPEVKAVFDTLLGRVSNMPTSSRPAPLRTVVTDRAAREAWADQQRARARELGLG